MLTEIAKFITNISAGIENTAGNQSKWKNTTHKHQINLLRYLMFVSMTKRREENTPVLTFKRCGETKCCTESASPAIALQFGKHSRSI